MYRSDVLYEDTCIKVYDPEKKELVAVYKTYSKASNRLGVGHSTVQHKCESKRRMYSPMLKKDVAVRIGVMKEGDLELISLTDRFQTLPKKEK